MTADRCKAMAREMADIAYPKICKITKDLWRQWFNLDELKQINEWMSSPVGKKMGTLVSRLGDIRQQIFQDPEFLQQIIAVAQKYTDNASAAEPKEQN